MSDSGQKKPADAAGLDQVLTDTFGPMDEARARRKPELRVEETGTVVYVGNDVARIRGLPHVRADELVAFPGDRLGMVFNLDPDEIAAVLLDESRGVEAGMEVRRTGRVVDVPVGDSLLGRVVDAAGRPLDGRGAVMADVRWPAERPAPPIMDRLPVTVPLQTGIRVIDALIPVGRGQRELIIGDRQTGKTAIALDTMINQSAYGVICIYCAIGQRSSAVARLIADLKRFDVFDNCIVVVAGGEDPLGQRFIAPYAATTMGEFFMEQGRDVLIVYDDLSVHAKTYRELSLLMRRPPAREAYPGDIFYIHSRLLERSTHLVPERGGGSLTALPIVETEAQNISAYIPTNLISITDGQIYLSPRLFQEGFFPAVDVGRSVSRVGGKTQLPSYQDVSGSLRLSYTQFEELEAFARFGTSLEEETRRALERGRRVREVLKQRQFSPQSVSSQIAVLLAVTSGLFDTVPLEHMAAAKAVVAKVIKEELPEIARWIESGEKPSDDDRQAILDSARRALVRLVAPGEPRHEGDAPAGEPHGRL